MCTQPNRVGSINLGLKLNIEFDEVVELDEVVALAVSDEALELAAGGTQEGGRHCLNALCTFVTRFES